MVKQGPRAGRPTTDVRLVVDEVVARLRDACDGVGAAAAGGAPGAFVLAQELDRRATRPSPVRRPLPHAGRERDVQAAFELTDLELDLLCTAATVDLDSRAATLVGYAHDDLTRRRPSIGLAAAVCGLAVDDPDLHLALGPASRLASSGLVVTEDTHLPFPLRALRCPDRVVRCLVGLDDAMPPVTSLLVEPPPLPGEDAERIAAAISTGIGFHYLHASPGTDPRGLAVAAAAAVPAGAFVVDLERLRPPPALGELADVLVAIVREARLRRSILVAGPVDVLLDAGASLETLAGSGWPTILHGLRSWDPMWTRQPPLLGTAPAHRGDTQAALWQRLLAEQAPPEDDLAALGAAYRLTGEQVALAATAALTEAVAEARSVEVEDLRRSARRRNTGSLERLARRVHPAATWDDLILPAATLEKLRELVARARHREVVYDEWGLAASGQRSDGLSALFAGPSGTGKTLAAEVVAGAIGFDLYVVDLSTVVDKFVGETEKNLERIFDEAERVNGVLVFDEADALFGKRSEVSDAHDRYANLETAYLLQRMEAFGGTAILTTNLRSNLDDAFARRLGAVVPFPSPDPGARLALWRRFLGGKLPVAEDVDLEFCAGQFDLTGANIRNVAVAAAFFAADAGPPVEMEHVIRALEREYEKLGRLRNNAEFGPYAHLLSDRPRS
ncbi:MAG TPA: ATP-binding protein [Acidimicrobiales bacterium]|nr:ATP-binding protein [Acidimicrobiales bacterium]